MSVKKIVLVAMFLFSSSADAVYNYKNYPWSVAGYDLIHYAKSHREAILLNAKLLYPKYHEIQIRYKKVFSEYQVPPEILVLAAIESGFKTNAESSVGAVGMWQLMPITAKSLGLVVNKHRDDRKIELKSTIAAIKYIKWLAESQYGGDYETAILSYNYGVGNMSRAMSKAKSSNAWVLISESRVPTESANHLMKFLSYVSVFKHMDAKLEKQDI